MFTNLNLKKKFRKNNKIFNLDLGKTHNISKEFFPLESIIEGKKKKDDNLINNYNLKVNITKKKTKNISIGNLTMNNKSKSELLSILNTPMSRSISPFNSLNVKKYVDKKIEKSKDKSSKVSSAIDSPRSYDKMISKLKNEFAKIRNKNSKERKTIHSNNNKYMNKSFNLNMNKNFKVFIKNKSKSKKDKEKSILLNKNIKRNLSNNIRNNTNCFINNINFDIKNKRNIDIKNKSKYIHSQQISFSIISKNKYLKEKNLINELNQKNNLIDFLLKFISIIKNVFIKNISFYANKYFQFIDSEKNKELNKQIDLLINENKNLKQVSLSLIYYLKEDYSLNIENEKKIKQKVSELLKENTYLRTVSQSLNYLKNVNYQNLKFKNQFGEEEDEISFLFKQSFLEKTIKEKNNIIKNKDTVNLKDLEKIKNNSKNNSINSIDTIINRKGNNIYKMKRMLQYKKKKFL